MAKGAEYNIIDRINLRDLSESIRDFMNSHNIHELGTTKLVLACVLGESEKDKQIFQLSQSISNNADPSNNDILRDGFAEEEYFMEQIMSHSLIIEKKIRDVKIYGETFLEELLDSCNEFHFSRDELVEIKKTFVSAYPTKKHNFIGLLFVHAIQRVSINLPGRMSDRLFNEALTLSPNNPMRSKLIKCAADCGHYYATLMYANEIYSDTDRTLDYFLSAIGHKISNDSNALWEVAFMIENHKLSEIQFERVKAKVNIESRLQKIINDRRKIDRNELIDTERKDDINVAANEVTNRDYLVGFNLSNAEINQGLHFIKDEFKKYAYKIYLYVAKRNGDFPKAFNSLGKLLLDEYTLDVSRIPDEFIDELRFDLATNYLRTAIRFGNTNAMVNLAVYYHNQHKLFLAGRRTCDLNSDEKKEMRYLFETAAAFDEKYAKYCLGELYLEDKNYKAARECLEFSANPTTPKAYHELGKICATEGDYENAQKNFEKAINNGIYNAAYDLAAVYLHRYVSTSDKSRNTYLQYGAYLLRTNIPMMSDEYKEKAAKWLAEWEDIT